MEGMGLHTCVEISHISHLSYLQRADPNSVDRFKRTPLEVRCCGFDVRTLAGLNPFIMSLSGSTLVQEAVRGGHQEVVQILIQHGGRVLAADGSTLIDLRCE